MSHLIWVLGAKPKSSERTMCILNCREASVAAPHCVSTDMSSYPKSVVQCQVHRMYVLVQPNCFTRGTHGQMGNFVSQHNSFHATVPSACPKITY